MYARSVRYSLRLGARSTFESWANELAPLYRERRGFCHLAVLMEPALAEYAVLSFWETKEDAEAAGAVRPEAQQWLDRVLQGPPVIRVYEQFEPRLY